VLQHDTLVLGPLIVSEVGTHAVLMSCQLYQQAALEYVTSEELDPKTIHRVVGYHEGYALTVSAEQSRLLVADLQRSRRLLWLHAEL
jgi:hypothetical protein